MWIIRSLLLLSLFAASAAHAQGFSESHYAGLQLGPTVHFSAARPHLLGGAGLDLSIGRFLDLEGWMSRVSRPNFARDSRAGAWSRGVAVSSRVAGNTHAFVYGAGLVYTSEFECPEGCTVFAAISVEEHRAALDLLTGLLRAGYEGRAANGLFGRALVVFNVPLAASGEVADTGYGREPTRLDLGVFMHASLSFTLGYAFELASP